MALILASLCDHSPAYSPQALNVAVMMMEAFQVGQTARVLRLFTTFRRQLPLDED